MTFFVALRSSIDCECQEKLLKNRSLKKCKLERKKGSKTPFFDAPIDFRLQRRLFYDATEAVLPCKTG